jgi:hypothetical protein
MTEILLDGEADNVGLVKGDWYTQQQLLDVARSRGHKVSQGLLEKWVGYGLLDRGTQHGRGKGRGALFLWSGNQLELLLALLTKRLEVSRVRVLLNLPVGVWLYWGDDYIPLRQVRRAMESWADVGRKHPHHDWNGMAKRVVEGIASTDSRRQDKEVAADLIVGLARERSGDMSELVEALEPLVGPDNPSLFTDAPRVAQSLVAQVTALDQIQAMPDEVFRWARAMMLVSQAIYQHEQPRLASDPRFGSLHPTPTFEQLVVGACSHLTTVLGLYLVQPPAGDLPIGLDPELWKRGRVRMEATAAYNPSPITLPPRREGGNVRVNVRIEVDPEQ